MLSTISTLNPILLGRRVPLSEVAVPIPFCAADTLYLCRDGGVELYVPVWCYPNVIRPWREYLDVRVYPTDCLPPHQEFPRGWAQLREWFDPLEPEWVIDENVITSSYPSDPAIAKLLRNHHDDIWAAQWDFVINDTPQALSPGEPLRIAVTPYYHFVIRGPARQLISPPFGRGPLLRLDDPDEFEDMVEAVRRHRYAIGVELNAMSSVAKEDVKEATFELGREITVRYPGRVASHSPPPFDDVDNW